MNDVEKGGKLIKEICTRRLEIMKSLGMTNERGDIDVEATIEKFNKLKADLEEIPSLKKSEFIRELISCANVFFIRGEKWDEFVNGSEYNRGLFTRTTDGEQVVGLFEELVSPLERATRTLNSLKELGGNDTFKNLRAEMITLIDEKFEAQVAERREARKQIESADDEREEISDNVEEADEEESARPRPRRGGSGDNPQPP